MPSLIDVLETFPADEANELPGQYDTARRLRVDASGCPVVEQLRSLGVGTETRGGKDRDDDSRSAGLLDTITKGTADRDEPRSLILTKTGGGRDTDEPRSSASTAAPFGESWSQ